MKWAKHVALTGDKTGIYRVPWGDLRERDNLEDLRLDGRIISN
jgi:hypothetical protein